MGAVLAVLARQYTSVPVRGQESEMVSDSESEVISERPIESLYEQDFYALRDECLKSKTLFEDPEFLPREEFLRERSKQHQDIVWLRPSDLSRPDIPILVSNKNEGFDIKHGLDSWFVPAFSAIADSTALLNHVIPPDQGFSKHENYSGIFHFRFWFGRWIEIVIDDSDSDTLIETKALLDQTGTSHFDERSLRSEPKYGMRSEGRATPIYGSTTGRGNQLYGRTGGRATPLYGSRLQLEHVNDNMSERSVRSRNN